MHFAFFLNPVPTYADTRVFAGSITTRWQTEGEHGHDQPSCGLLDCDERDFKLGNLDNSIGVRAGAEHDLQHVGRAFVLIAADVTLLSTEYNLDQDDVTIGMASASAGAFVPAGPLRLGSRIGGGPFATSDGKQAGMQWFVEASASAGPFRVSHRRTTFAGGPRVHDTAMMFAGQPPQKWQLASYAGVTDPGGDRALTRAEFHRLAAFRDVRWRNTQLQISWTGTAHESGLESTFLGYPGNFRTKVIDAYGAGIRRTHRLETLSFHYGAAIEVADWEDDHELLENAAGGIEGGVAISAGTRYRVTDAFTIEASIERAEWPGVEVGETRYLAGIVLTP